MHASRANMLGLLRLAARLIRLRTFALAEGADDVGVNHFLVNFRAILLLGDTAPLKSSMTRADNLYQASGRPIALFIDAMYQARAKTKERTAAIRGKANGATPYAPKAKIAYFFALLEDELGLRQSEQLPLDG